MEEVYWKLVIERQSIWTENRVLSGSNAKENEKYEKFFLIFSLLTAPRNKEIRKVSALFSILLLQRKIVFFLKN
ncbi:MAG: hypothetical protein HUJ74_00770 [Lachnospiraceae bacterium]|nr:hypothetical protein [Lachnospiraceae bacterium]